MKDQQFDSSSRESNIQNEGFKITAYQLLRLRDFESDPDKIEKAYTNLSQELEEAKAEMEKAYADLSQDLEEAKATLSNKDAKEAYDEQLRRTGYADLPRLGFWGGSAIFFSFVLSIAIVIVSTFYIYPIIVPVEPEPFGDSITTLAEYDNAGDERNWNEIKAKQQDIMTMNVNIDMPITVDAQFEEEFTESATVTDEPAIDTTVPTPTQPEPTVPTDSTSIPQAEPQPVVETPSEQSVPEQPAPSAIPEQPAVEQANTAPEVPVVPEQSVPEQPVPSAVPEEPTVEQANTAPEVPAVPEQSVPEQPTPSTVPEEPTVEQANTAPEVPTVPEQPVPEQPVPTPESPASDQTTEPGLLEVPATPTQSDTPVTEQPAVSTVENSTLQSVGAQPLASPKQIPTSVVNTIAEFAKTVQTKEQYGQLFKSAQQAETELIKNKEFVYAEQIANIVYKACLTPEGKQFRSERLQHKEQISKLTKQWINVSAAQVRFAQLEDKTQPNADADVIATWTIDVDNDWNTGLQYLLVSTDEHVRNAAQKDKNADVSKVESCIATADAWWNASQTPSVLQKQYRNRANYWYSKALPSVTDKNTKTLIEKRLSKAK